MKQLKEVESFGAVDADADKLLDKCFEDHEAYLDARSHKKFLVIGRKGSGKTAIYRKLLKEKRFDTFAFGHDFSASSIHLRLNNSEYFRRTAPSLFLACTHEM